MKPYIMLVGYFLFTVVVLITAVALRAESILVMAIVGVVMIVGSVLAFFVIRFVEECVDTLVHVYGKRRKKKVV